MLVPRGDQETVVAASSEEVVVYTTNPSHWRALKRRAKALGGEITQTYRAGSREVGGEVRLPPDSFTPTRFGLRAKPRKSKP
jgi:hypothetical protein